MKSYKEVSDSVFERSNQIIFENKLKRKKYAKAGLAAVSLCLVAAVSIVFAKGKLDNTHIAPAEGAKYNTVDDSAGTAQKKSGDSPEKESTAVSREDQASSSQSKTTAKAGKDKKVISNYEEGATACYATPENGKFYFSIPLTHAKEEYGDKVIYKLAIDVFSDSTFLKDEKKAADENARLKSRGYKTELDGKRGRWIITAEMTAEEMENFPPDLSLGYFFFLYDEPDSGMKIPLT